MRFILPLLVTFCLAAQAAEIRRVDVEHEGKRYYVDSDTIVDAPIESVYAVLTDYEHFDLISSVFTESRFIEPVVDGSGLVYTRAQGCILFFCNTIERVERLEVRPVSDIVTVADPERSDVKYSRAHWQLEEDRQGTRVRYSLELEPDFWVPPVIGPWLIKRSLTRNGEEAVARIELLALERASARVGVRP
ncbi:MAG: SRPBCC family protein [Gammaproteobacteria bacterium]